MNQKRTLLLGLAGLVVSTFGAMPQSGGPFTLRWHTIDGGGGQCAGGAFTLQGTAGQPESGDELRSDRPALAGPGDLVEAGTEAPPVFALRTGFWSGVLQNEASPRLNIAFDQPFHRVILSWPFPSSGYMLQHATSLNASPAAWSNTAVAPVVVGTNWQLSFRITNSARMFRLLRR